MSSAHHDQLLGAHLRSVFGELDAAALALLREHLRWVEVAGGQTLIEQGEPGDSLYLIVSGRLRAYVRRADNSQRMVREMARGEIIGEIAMYANEPRSATVVAIRDSVLVRLDKEPFDRLIALSPQVSLALTRQIVHRLKTEHEPSRFAAPVTIGVFAVSAAVDPADFASQVAAALAKAGRVCIVDSTQASAGLAATNETGATMALRLDEIEATHDFVLLVADRAPSAWTHLCARHSDELLLLAQAGETPQLHAVELQCIARRPPRTEAAELLVLLHPADAAHPVGTEAWLARRPLAGHLHVRSGVAGDHARVARVLSRSAVGLVLAGGGARGFAHFGVLRALQESGIEVDFVGGTSMGSVMGALVASDKPLPAMLKIARQAFRRNPTGDFNLLPLISLIKGRRLRQTLRAAVVELLGSPAASIEDLWKPFFCIATNYSQAQEMTLQHGTLEKALLASTAIPGALPPVVLGGDLLCDGGAFNNFPVDVMRGLRGVGTVIGVDLGSQRPQPLTFDEVPGTWTLLRDRLRPRSRRRYRLPSLAAYLMNVTILYSTSRRAESQRAADIVFNPPLSRVGLLHWSSFDSIVEQGYAHAKDVLARPEVAAKLKLQGG
jgi:NTE family protein